MFDRGLKYLDVSEKFLLEFRRKAILHPFKVSPQLRCSQGRVSPIALCHQCSYFHYAPSKKISAESKNVSSRGCHAIR